MSDRPNHFKMQAFRTKKAILAGWSDFRSRLHPNPLFVFGNQKSGTSVIAALLGASTDLPVTLDFPREISRPRVPDVWNDRMDLKAYLRLNRTSFSRPVIKEPSITFLAERLLRAYPDSKAIFVIRHPYENIRSILDRLELPGDLPDLEGVDLGRISSTWMTVLDNRWQGLDSDHYIGQLAARWSEAARICRRVLSRAVVVRYEDFEQDKTGVIHDLVRRVGFEPIRSIDHLLDHQYQPAGRRGRSPRTIFGPNLSIIDEICWPLAAEFGYERAESEDGP